ncbi:GntR family transcriptional regulator [Neobacillus niacini]|uniref:GntR family transcriptional regulator n=1 Tax=Neobacillus niacini TaxID=86668 RepID=UPI002FFEC05B
MSPLDSQSQYQSFKLENRSSSAPIPLYYRIKEYLIHQIEFGSLLPGDQIQTEDELSELFKVSRMTARRAVNELAQEKRLIRKQGIGTFVAEPSIDRQLTKLTTLTEELQQLGYTGLRSTVLAWSTHKAQNQLAKALSIQAGERVLRIRRVRYTGDVPIAMQTIIIPDKFAPGLQPTNIGKLSMYQVIEENTKQSVKWASQKIDAVLATPYLAKWLEVPIGSPLFKVTRQAFFDNEQPMDIARTYYRADRYSFQINLYRD